MANSKGHLTKAGAKKGTTWGTAVALAAGGGIHLAGFRPGVTVPRTDDTSVSGSAQMPGADITSHAALPTLTLPARYEGMWLTLLALLFGTAGVPTGTNPYVHTFKPKNDLTGLFATLGVDLQVEANPVWEFPSCAVESFTIRSQAGSGEGARAEVSFELVADRLQRASGVNSTTQIALLTFPTAGHLLHHNLTVRMNIASGGALGAPEVLKVRGFELTIRNNLKRDLFYSGSQYIDQPDRDGFIEVTGSLLLDKYSLDSPGVTEFIAGTYMKLDAAWTTGASAIFKFEIPRVQLSGGDRDLSGAGLISAPIPFKAYDPTAAPTGMTTTDLIWLLLTNTASADYLA